MPLASSQLSPVRVIGRYALHDEIASGGMATVHIGRLLGPVGFSRTVAIKRLHPQFAKEPDFVAMFLDEARLAARVRHPNVVGTLDVVALEGELFLVMEYVQGESLGRLMRTMRDRGEPVPIPIAAAIILGVLEGLHAAHEATSDQGEPLGIVHRDVSPQNILVGTDGIARVVDFGVAKAAGRMQSTRDGQLKGKLGYMAPEQIGGNSTRVTDVHAVAVILWEMLAARRLYHADTELQTFSNILSGELVPPSKYMPKVPAEIDAVVMKGLEPRPEARFSSAREMARALQRVARIASPSDVGEWVESIAGPNVHSRARKIVAMESSGTLPIAAPSSPEPFDAGPASVTTSVPRVRSDDGQRRALSDVPASVRRVRSDQGQQRVPSDVPASVTMSASRVSGERRSAPRSRLPLVIPIALATVALGAAIGVWLGSSGRASLAAPLPAASLSTVIARSPAPLPIIVPQPSPGTPSAAAPPHGQASTGNRPPPDPVRPGAQQSALSAPRVQPAPSQVSMSKVGPSQAGPSQFGSPQAGPAQFAPSQLAPAQPQAQPTPPSQSVHQQPAAGGGDFAHVMDSRK